MPTEAMINAALNAYDECMSAISTASHETAMAVALVAADRAAWITDMDAAKGHKAVLAATPDGRIGGWSAFGTAWWTGGCMNATHWRPLPLPPETTND